MTDLGDRYHVAAYARGYVVIDVSTDEPVSRIYDQRHLAERSAARRNPSRPQPKDVPMTAPSLDEFTPQGDLDRIKRNQWGQPLITPPGGGKAVGYQRVTTFIKVMESGFGLEQWKLRQVVCGLMARPDLQMAVSAHAPGYLDGDTDDKKTLDNVCKQALDAAASSGKATIGTALHRITERWDRGQLDPAEVPEWAKADLEAYKRATDGIEWLHIERMTVCDDLRVAGTPDRIGIDRRVSSDPTTFDLKTGSGVWASSCAAQLGVYSNSLLYDIATGERSDLGARKDIGVVIHLPAGSGRVSLRKVDIAAGWAEVKDCAPRVHAWQKNRTLDLGEYERATEEPAQPSLVWLIEQADSAATLGALWKAHRDEWTDEHTALAAQRKTALAS